MSAGPETPIGASPSVSLRAEPVPLWLRVLSFPRTPAGWWAVIFEVGFIIFITLLQVLIASGQRGGKTFFANPILAATLIVASLSAISGLALGLFSFMRRKERSLLVLIAVILGLFVLIFTIGELVGHD